MPITSHKSDPDTLTLTIVADYAVPLERLWAAWADPRQLERFWGPPTWPATFTRHDMAVGGRSEYFMTGPEGQTSHGYWRFLRVEAPTLFEVQDGFAQPDGTATEGLPTCTMCMQFEATAAGSRFTSVTTFPSLEAMEQMVAMGMEEGIKAALGQMDAVLADLRDSSKSWPTALEVVDDTHLRVTRTVRGSMQQVWRAHHEAALMQRWMLGPPGWTMPVCEVAEAVGDAFRYEWESDAGDQRFGFVGELLESEAPRRAVTTERPIGMDVTPNVNELVLTPLPGNRTQIVVTITTPSREVTDIMLGTGMVDGMEASYARLEGVIG